ncbi:MAG: tryptophan--tRNA ligase [Helicobacteraceae bacterium]|jgi:tryptophanyl-tRNA synthetase|nr:tryptophan--tRNA ligase [Helicobacteraceae bacterium]
MRTLSGIQPSGEFHIGNYFGMISQMLRAQEKEDVFIFLANYHALTSVFDGKKLSDQTKNAAIDLIALGIDPTRACFWAQSDVKEVLELYWILSQYAPMGLLERAHSYKDKIAKGLSPSHGLFSYPVLMAADILLYDTDVVPVGRDQIQHVEIARDIAIKFNNACGGSLLTLPEFRVEEDVAVIPGVDGAKMSKSYSNTIDIFLDRKSLEKRIKQIVTAPIALELPKEWKGDTVFGLCALFLDENGQEELKRRYERGGEGHGHFKAYLLDLIWSRFASARAAREKLRNDPQKVSDLLSAGAKKAGLIAAEKMRHVREAVGIYNF